MTRNRRKAISFLGNSKPLSETIWRLLCQPCCIQPHLFTKNFGAEDHTIFFKCGTTDGFLVEGFIYKDRSMKRGKLDALFVSNIYIDERFIVPNIPRQNRI